MVVIKYNVILSRRRSMSIIVRPDKSVTVRAPLRTPVKAIESFVAAKSDWIIKHLNKSQGTRLSNNGKQYTDGELFMYLGKEYGLQKIVSGKDWVKLNGEYMEVGQEDPEDNAKTGKLITGWYFLNARRELSERMRNILQTYRELNFIPSGLVIRQLKSRWGSCSSKGKITLNSEMVKLNPALIDYVIIHELCHLKQHNHGPEFHKLLGELIPEYKTLRKELRKFVIR